jgi:hypothetical protein
MLAGVEVVAEKGLVAIVTIGKLTPLPPGIWELFSMDLQMPEALPVCPPSALLPYS